jgi:hypothetical protein
MFWFVLNIVSNKPLSHCVFFSCVHYHGQLSHLM